ncbi:RNA-directed DNA polymerase, eukaryota, reverse transcriptase zinc-binding domain protein [Tanacetum coccineum]
MNPHLSMEVWRRVINDFYGSDDGFDSPPSSRYQHGTWCEILKAVDNIKNIDPSFSAQRPLPQVISLDSCQDCSISDRWGLINGSWSGTWSWRSPRGRAIDDVSSLVSLISSIFISGEGADNWVWSREASGIFKVNTLSVHLQELLLADHSLGSHHIWNSWTPRKVNIYVWRASINRLPTRSNLLMRGVNIGSDVCSFLRPLASLLIIV